MPANEKAPPRRRRMVEIHRELGAALRRISLRGRHDEERSENCATAVEEVSRICHDGNPDAGTGDWSERGGVQRAQRAGVSSSECAACAESLHSAAIQISVAVLPRLFGSAG